MKISFKKIWCLLCVVFGAVLGSANAAVTYVHTDHLGSVIAESNSAGQITKRFHYRPFGESIEAQQDDIGYAAHKFDTDLGLSYMEARYYDPVLGRFYGNDPIGFRDVHSFNRYAYANNNPYLYKDPTGEFGVVGFLIGAGIEAAVQYATTGTIDVSDVVIAGAVGAVTGGFAGNLAKSAATGVITTSTAVKETAKVAFSTGVAGSAAKSAVNGEAPDAKKMALGGAANAVGSAVGAKIATAGAAKLEAMAKAGGIQGHIAQATQSKVFPDAAEAATATTGEAGKVTADAAAASAEAALSEEIKKGY